MVFEGTLFGVRLKGNQMGTPAIWRLLDLTSGWLRGLPAQENLRKGIESLEPKSLVLVLGFAPYHTMPQARS